MALPTGPIPRVALDEIIEENWGDWVAQSLNNLAQRRDASNWKPTADINAPTASTMTVWFNFGGGAGTDITVPDWAQNAYARMEINGVEDLGTPNGTYDLQTVHRHHRRPDHPPDRHVRRRVLPDRLDRPDRRVRSGRGPQTVGEGGEGVGRRSPRTGRSAPTPTSRSTSNTPAPSTSTRGSDVPRPYVTDLPARRDVTFYHQLGLHRRRRLAGLRRDHPGPGRLRRAHLRVRPAGHHVRPGHRGTANRTRPRCGKCSTPSSTGLELGQVMFIVPNGLWSTVTGRSGNWDVVALSTDGIRRQLVRGIFTVEQGVTT